MIIRIPTVKSECPEPPALAHVAMRRTVTLACGRLCRIG